MQHSHFLKIYSGYPPTSCQEPLNFTDSFYIQSLAQLGTIFLFACIPHPQTWTIPTASLLINHWVPLVALPITGPSTRGPHVACRF